MTERVPYLRLVPRQSAGSSTAKPATKPASLPDEPLWRHVLGEHLRRLRHERGETLIETAAKAGVSPQYLSEMERGLKEPSSEMIAAVAGALETSLGELTGVIARSLHAGPRVDARYGATCMASVVLAA